MAHKLRVLLDANVLLAALLSPQGGCRRLLLLASAGAFEAVVNVDHRAWLQSAPPPAHGQSPATEAQGPDHLLLRDMGDAHLIASALRHGCAWLCTGNARDFPTGFAFQGIQAIAPGALLRLLEGPP